MNNITLYTVLPIYTCFIRFLFIIQCYYCQDIFFPDDERVTHPTGNKKILITDRSPIFNRGACPENMLRYPGGGGGAAADKSVWLCDCRPSYLYFPSNDSCHEAYRQGPCRNGQYLVLPKDQAVPKCQKNPCNEDGKVLYKGICYGLKTTGGPCEPDVIGVNETTYQLECTPSEITPFIIIDAPQIDPCPAGSRRNSLGSCKTAL